MSRSRRRLRNENARLRAEVARLQAELKRLREVGPLQELLSRSLPRVVREITRREAVQNAATAIRKDPLGFWEMVEPPDPKPQVVMAEDGAIYADAPAVAEINRIQAFFNEANDNQLFRQRHRLIQITATGEPPTPPKKGDQILRERSYGAELREFNGEKWVTIKMYHKNGATDDRD